MNIKMNDNGGRRKKTDRRQFKYTFHVPERRSGMDRRDGEDRREKDRNSGGAFDMNSNS